MKAIIASSYGPPEQLRLEEVPEPQPKDHEVIVQITATAVNDYAWSMVTGNPGIYKLLFGLLRPKHRTPGMELSGTVSSVGTKVSKWLPGDEVFGDISGFGFGAMAEKVSIHEDALVAKPVHISHLDAASLSHASLLAWQSIQPHLDKIRGGKVLINGGGGGVGTFGLQMLKLHNCHVTGVDTGKKLEMMRDLGFDHVLDYSQTDFTQTEDQYDFILDCKTFHGPRKYLKALKPGGVYVTVGGSIGKLLRLMLTKGVYKLLTGKRLSILSLKPNQGIENVLKMHQDGQLKCIVDGPYPLETYPKKLRYFGEGKHSGKVVIGVEE